MQSPEPNRARIAIVPVISIDDISTLGLAIVPVFAAFGREPAHRQAESAVSKEKSDARRRSKMTARAASISL